MSERSTRSPTWRYALFDEWDELEQYTNQRLRADSERKLAQTQRRYDGLIKVMRKSEENGAGAGGPEGQRAVPGTT